MGPPVEAVTAGVGSGGGSARSWLGRLRRGGRDRRLLAAAAVVFVVALALALADLPVDDLEPRWGFVVALALVGAPAAVVVNALEYVVTGAVRGQRIGLRPAAQVAVLSSAANLLPIPGAALVRVQALRRLGWTSRHAAGATALVGAAWLATTLAVAGVVVAVAGEPSARAVAGALGVGGVLGCAVVAGLLARAAGRGRGRAVATAVLAVEALAVAVGALRYLLVFAALGAPVAVAQALALTVATVVASAVGFFPGGLGLRELLAGAISPVVGVPAAVGLVGVAVDRVVGLAVLGLLALGLLRRTPDAG